MKSGIKLALGAAFAAAAIMAASQSVSPDTQAKTATGAGSCYSQREVQLLMKSNHWSEQEAKTILDLVCKFSAKAR